MTKEERKKKQSRQLEVSSKMGEFEALIATRELTADEQKEYRSFEAEYKKISRELQADIQERQSASLEKAPVADENKQLREFLKKARKGDSFMVSMKRDSITYGETTSYSGTEDYVQGLSVVDLINTDRKDADIMTKAGVPMVTGVRGNKIQWAFAGGVEAVFANELASTTERVISLDKQVPVQNRLTVRVRITNQAIENTEFDLRAFIITAVSQAIKDKINWAAASTTKATTTLYGGFAQDDESGTYGQSGYTPGKQTGTYTSFTKDTAAAMIAKVAGRNLPLDNALFVMGSEDFWALKVTPMDSGSGKMIISDDNRILGIPVVEDNAINRSSQKGTISGHNIGLGNFKYLPVMQHGDIRLSVDSGSAVAAATDELIVTLNADFSMTVLQDGADAFVLYSQSE